MSKAFVMDDEHWITINGNHVLINEKGEVQSGLGGALKGVKLSKATSSMKGGKFKDRSKERNEAQGVLEKENVKAKERLRREFVRHDKENRKNQEEADKDYDKDSGKVFGYGRAYNRLRELDPKKYSELMKRVKERGKSLERAREARQQGFEEKRQNLYAAHEKRKSKIIKEENEKRKPLLKSVLRKDKQLDTAKETLSSARSKLKSTREANAYMKQRGTKVSKATPDMVGGKFKTKEGELNATYERRSAQLDKLYRDKEKIRKENSDKKEKYSKAIQRLRNRRTEVDPSEKDKYKKLTSGMRERANELDNVTEAKLKNVSNRIKKLRDANAEERGAIIKKYGQAKQTLEKARPKIAERREAIRKYNDKRAEERYREAVTKNPWAAAMEPYEKRLAEQSPYINPEEKLKRASRRKKNAPYGSY